MKALHAHFDISFPNFHLHVTLDVPADGVIGLFGPSGCGKTTLLRCLAGLERSPKGVMRFGEEVWQDESRGVFLPVSQRPVGYVFQEPRLFPHLSVRSNLEFGFKRTPVRQRKLSFDQIVEILDIRHLLTRRPHRLSGGEQQRIAIGRALLTSPRLLLMDEPLASLDTQRKREILPFLRKLDHELHIPIVYVSHSLSEILQITRSLAILDEGKVLASGPINEVLTRVDLPSSIGHDVVGAAIDTVVVGQESDFHLTKLEFMGKNLFIPFQPRSVGEFLRVHILAKDVSIMVGSRPPQTSVLNILEATVVSIGTPDLNSPSVDIKLDIGCPLLATITRKSLAHLGLKPGQNVLAQIKAVALGNDLVG